jgi:3'-phosphoadenosine 5'-phosphosulfate sulfotransferase (PAPS reductase)/FAD synthetase
MNLEALELQAIDVLTRAALLWYSMVTSIAGIYLLSGGFGKLAVSFNGGKDCTVLLALFLKAAQRAGYVGRLMGAYVKTPHPFPELESFIGEALQRDQDRFELHVYDAMPLKEGFRLFIAETGATGVLVGIRSTDPYGGISLSNVPFSEL